MRRTRLLPLLLPLLALSAHAKDAVIPDTYRWVAEKGFAIGCVREKRRPSALPLRCAEIGTLDFACSSVYHAEFIKDIAECRRHLPVKTAWLKGGVALDCVATAEGLDGEATNYGVLEHRPASDCEYNTIRMNEGCELTVGEPLKFHPNSKLSVEDLVPEILNLADGAVVPKEVYAKYDSRKIAASIVQKIYQTAEQEKSEKVAKPRLDFLNDGAIKMAFNHANIDLIAKNGFLNQHEIPKSNGTFAPEMRAEAEDKFLGYKLEETYSKSSGNPVNKVRPKYSFFDLNNVPLPEHPMYKGVAGMITKNYGNVFAVFSPEVKDRATFTMSDSLGGPKESVRTMRYRADDPNDPTQKAFIYMETQIWGDLEMKDVKHFIVNCAGFEKVPDEAIEKLKALGKPIYNCRVDKKYTYPFQSFSKGMGSPFTAGAIMGTTTDTKTESGTGAPLPFTAAAEPAPEPYTVPIRVREAGILYNDPRQQP